MKKILWYVIALSGCCFLCFACGNGASQSDDNSSDSTKITSCSGMKLAYVEIDSLMTQYEFCKDFTLVLQKKSDNARSTLSAKERTLQTAITNFQNKYNNNGFTSREEAATTQASLERQQQDLQELQARLVSELEVETNKYNNALRDSLQSFLAEYNAVKKYDMILAKGGDNILLADPRYDITSDVINGLNKRYTPTK